MQAVEAIVINGTGFMFAVLQAQKRAIRRPGEQRPMKQSREAKTEMQRAKDMKANQCEELLRTLKSRFEKNMNRHKGLEWAKVHANLEVNTEKLR